MSTLDLPSDCRSRPCVTCPYRVDVPSGVWTAEEYHKLPDYDGEILDQVRTAATRPFYCHSSRRQVCAGWAGHRPATELLAVRLGISHGTLDPAVADFSTDVELFATGAEAAAHGMADVDNPGPAARDAIAKLVQARERQGWDVASPQ